MTSTDSSNRECGKPWYRRIGSLSTTPEFNLIYLVFLFIPWFFLSPRPIDIVAALVALAVFVPVHFRAFRADTDQRIVYIAVVAMLGVATSFFVLGSGVFHIYCAAMAGFCRPVRRSGVVLGLCLCVYLLAAYFTGRAVPEMIFMMLMSIIVWFSTLSTAQTMIEAVQQEREQELDRQTVSLMERERIGRDLHDLLGHTLTMVALKSDLANRLIDTDPEQAKEQIREIQDGARQALMDVRVALSDMATVSVSAELDNARQALEAANVALTVEGVVPALTAEQEQVYGLMIREAVTNIIRHTSASAARIQFATERDGLQLTITDNGDGKIAAEGRGLTGLRKRIESLGGSVRIRDDHGVSLSARLPV